MSKSRYFATVCYPESGLSLEAIKECLDESHIPYAVSPLHDMDVNADGEIKKSHYHVLLMFDNTTTDTVAKEVFSKINGVGCELVRSKRGYFRYLCHKDNPEKFQYDESLITYGNGIDPDEFLSERDMDQYYLQIMEFIEKYDIYEYWVLLRLLSENEVALFRFACNHTLFCTKALWSRMKLAGYNEKKS